MLPGGRFCRLVANWPVLLRALLDRELFARRPMASEIFGTAALFWVLIPIGLAGGALLLKLADND